MRQGKHPLLESVHLLEGQMTRSFSGLQIQTLDSNFTQQGLRMVDHQRKRRITRGDL